MKITLSKATRQRLEAATQALDELQREQAKLEARGQQLAAELEALSNALTAAEQAEREAVRQAAFSESDEGLDEAHDHTQRCRARLEHAQEMLAIVQEELTRVRGEEYNRRRSALRDAEEDTAAEAAEALLQPIKAQADAVRLAWEMVSFADMHIERESWLQELFKLPRRGSRADVRRALMGK